MEQDKAWRIESSEIIRGEPLRRKTYKSPNKEWDHDHCVACWRKFAEFDEAGILNEGYATIAGSKWGADYHWICPQCFSDLHEIMGWAEVS